MIDHVITVLVITQWLAALVFVVRYLFVTWYRSRMGVHLMAFMLVTLALCSLALVSVVFGRDWAGRQTVRLVTFSATNIVLWWRVSELFRSQRSTPRRLRWLARNVPK